MISMKEYRLVTWASLPALLFAFGCQAFSEPSDPWDPWDPDVNWGVGGTGGVEGSGGGLGCGESAPLDFFAVSPLRPASRVLFSWTTVEQVEEMRASGELLSREETPGLGRGHVFEVLDSYHQDATGELSTQQSLARELSARFTKARFAWPHAWPTRLGWPGESYGDQLIRIVLRPESLFVVARSGQLFVFDMEGGELSHQTALDAPERIAAIFFVKDEQNGGASCGTYGSTTGSLYREYVLGNPAMIESFSVGTAEVNAVIQREVQLLGELRATLQDTSPLPSSTFYSLKFGAACSWKYEQASSQARPSSPRCAIEDSYFQALALVSEYYTLTATNLSSLIWSLQSARSVLPLSITVDPEGAGGSQN